MIDKPSIIVTSIGRTGTKFFAGFFRKLIPSATSFHEPDVLYFAPRDGYGIQELFAQVGRSGASNLLLKKFAGRWSLFALSDARFKGKLCDKEVVERLYRQRGQFIASCSGSVYVEANAGYYGLIDLIGEVYRRASVIYIVRDGRSWVRSSMNWRRLYGRRGLRRVLGHSWPTAPELQDDPYRMQWDSMSRFERICWAWSALNGYALEAIRRSPNARLFRFEDLFKGDERYQYLATLVEFATERLGVERAAITPEGGWLERRVHESEKHFPAWSDWTPKQRERFREICGPLMYELGYWTT